jgi:hypothetical protein
MAEEKHNHNYHNCPSYDRLTQYSRASPLLLQNRIAHQTKHRLSVANIVSSVSVGSANIWSCHSVITCLMLNCFFGLNAYLIQNTQPSNNERHNNHGVTHSHKGIIQSKYNASGGGDDNNDNGTNNNNNNNNNNRKLNVAVGWNVLHSNNGSVKG